MGQYNKAVLTTAGEKLIARALAGEIKLNITKAKTSSYAYPSGTDFKSLTDMKEIMQAVADPTTTVYNDTIIQTRVLFSNEEITSTYYIYNIGLYAMDGTQEVLFCIVTAETPDEMPQYNGVASTSYIYNIQNVVQDSTELNITVNLNGTATIQDVLERVDATGGDISETVIGTLDTIEDKYPVPAAGESVKRFLGNVLTFLRNIKPLTGDITLYVATTGSDTTGDGSQANPFKTIQYTINKVPRNLGGHEARIIVANGIYQEMIVIENFSNGNFYLISENGNSLTDNCRITNLRASWNTCYMNIGGFSVTTTSDVGIYGYNNTALLLKFIKITENALSIGPDAIYIAESKFSAWNCMVSYHNRALTAYNSQGVVNSWVTGTGNNFGLFSSYGSVITVTGTMPAATVNPFTYAAGGRFIYDNGTQITGLINSGLSCTWGKIEAGGYYRNGNLSGVAQVIVNLRISIETPLTGGQLYQIGGFPTYSGHPIVAVTTHYHDNTTTCYLTNSGILFFIPKQTHSGVIIFSCTYITNS